MSITAICETASDCGDRCALPALTEGGNVFKSLTICRPRRECTVQGDLDGFCRLVAGPGDFRAQNLSVFQFRLDDQMERISQNGPPDTRQERDEIESIGVWKSPKLPGRSAHTQSSCIVRDSCRYSARSDAPCLRRTPSHQGEPSPGSPSMIQKTIEFRASTMQHVARKKKWPRGS